MALEDAVVLAKALRDLPSTTAALAAYQRHRRPRVEQNITTSARITAGAAPSPAAAPPGPPQQRDSANPVSRVQEQLVRQLDWDTTLLSC
jgi:2-polyprenyl-6-methoxyphenol hydroxylase-like FAD-dependent oxidoreductase